MDKSSLNLAAMKKLCDELYEEYAQTGDFAAIEEYFKFMDEFAREGIVRNLFWRMLDLGNTKLAEDLLNHGFSITPLEVSDAGPLHYTMWQCGDRPDLIVWLVDHGAELERRDLGNGNATPLIAAVGFAFNRTAELLLKKGAYVNASTQVDDDKTALMVAVATDNEDATSLLLNYGADVNQKDRWRKNAMQIANARGCFSIINILRNHER